MKTINAFIILLFIVTTSFGQIKYEKGYFINLDNERTECLIKNMDWQRNPADFSYKIGESTALKVEDVTSIKEFGIYNYYKFVGADVEIDRSSNIVDRLTEDRNPSWSKERLFLKVIAEGKAKLYSFEDSDVRRYFYSKTDTAIIQLIYKRYINGKAILENNTFRQQLWSYLRCENSSINMVKDIKYTFGALEKYIQSYNSSFGDTITEISNNTKRNHFNLKLAPGVNLMSMTISNSLLDSRELSFGTSIGLRMGLESELILPFNMNKWGIVIEPTLQYYKEEKEVEDKSAIVQFKSIEIPVGLRYYSFLNDHTKFFINGFYVSNFALNFDSKIEHRYKSEKTTLEVYSRNNYAIGGGIDYKRLSMEARYYSKRNMTGQYYSWSTDYSRFSIIVGYKLINSKNK